MRNKLIDKTETKTKKKTTENLDSRNDFSGAMNHSWWSNSTKIPLKSDWLDKFNNVNRYHDDIFAVISPAWSKYFAYIYPKESLSGDEIVSFNFFGKKSFSERNL